MNDRLQLEHVNPRDVLCYERNPRVHTTQQVEQLAAVIREMGFLAPILLDEHGVLIAGHCRREAALLLGLETIPAVRASHLTNAQVKALRIFDNQATISATYDLDALSAEVQDLIGEDYSLERLGFTPEYLAALVENNEAALEEAQRHEGMAQMRGPPPKEQPEGGGTGGDPGEERYKSQYGVIVICADEAEQRLVYERLKGDGLACRVVVT